MPSELNFCGASFDSAVSLKDFAAQVTKEEEKTTGKLKNNN